MTNRAAASLVGGMPCEQIKARFEAWWNFEVVDRALVTLSVPSKKAIPAPVKKFASLRERWLDASYAVDSFLAHLENSTFLGESFPVFNPNVGPEITSTLWGCELDFGDHTSWSHPVVMNPEQWNTVIDAAPNFENPYWQAIERMTDLAIERCEGRYVVGITDLHGNYDILAGLRDPQMLCMDMLDCPELVQRAGRCVAKGFVQAFERSQRKLAAAGFGSATWTPFFHGGPAYVPSCDFWCMVSDDAARDLIWPDILVEMQPMDRSIFHLDGPQALRHLDLLLDCPQLSAVQWVYGAGRGKATDWMDVYRRILGAGKSAQVLAQDAQDVLAVLDELGPRGLWFTLTQPMKNAEEAQALLREVAKR